MAPPGKHASQEVSIIVALMEQVEGLRADFKQTTETIVKKIDDQGKETADKVDTLRGDIAEMKERLARGSERMESMRRDIDSQGVKCAVHGTTALQRKAETAAVPPAVPSTSRIESKPKIAWWAVLLAGGALAWAGERGIQVVINALADKPAVAQVSPSKTP